MDSQKHVGLIIFKKKGEFCQLVKGNIANFMRKVNCEFHQFNTKKITNFVNSLQGKNL